MGCVYTANIHTLYQCKTTNRYTFLEKRKLAREISSKEQLGRRLVARISIWSLLVVFIASTATFFSTYPNYQQRIITSLQQDIATALVPAESLFARVTSQAETMTSRFLAYYQYFHTDSRDSVDQFDHWFEQTSPGVTRLKQSYFDGKNDNDFLIKGMSAFIGKSEQPLDDERKARIIAATLTLNELGPAWSNSVSNSHLSMPENALVLYSQHSAWGRLADKDLIMTNYSVLKSSLQSNNPAREPNWTGLYYDRSANLWTITYQRPIDLAGQHLANASFDVELTQLLEDLQGQRQDATQFMVLNQKGDLIAAPGISDKLKAQPLLNHDNYLEPVYQSVYQLMTQRSFTEGPAVFEDAVPGQLVIVQPLPRLGWWYVALYPQNMISEQAGMQSLRVFTTGIIMLGLLLLVVYWQVTREVSQPLRRLASVAAQMDSKNYEGVITNQEHVWKFKGEVKLALDAFRTMARRFIEAQLNLEQQVQTRTTELAQANSKLEEIAHIDGLTGLMNRRSFDRDLQAALNSNDNYILALADIDAFKPYNDHYGHEAGDTVLRRVGRCLQQVNHAQVYRYGGEEFALLVKETRLNKSPTLLNEVITLIEKLDIRHDFNHRDGNVVSISMGTVTIHQGQTPSNIIKLADENLYKAKAKGGNCLIG